MSAADGALTLQIEDEDPFEILPRKLLQDGRLSFRARGLLCFLLSKPPGWRTNASRLAADTKEGRDAVETALAELQDVGYLARRRVQLRGGTWTWVWLYGKSPERVASRLQARLLEISDELHPKWVAEHLGATATGLRAVE